METPALRAHAADSFVNLDVMADMAGRMATPPLVEVADTTDVIPVDNRSGLVGAVLGFL